MINSDIVGAVPFAILTAVLTWGAAVWTYRDKQVKEKAEFTARQEKEKLEHDDRLEIHRDGLTFNLLQTARDEVKIAYAEMKGVREEVKSLRALEKHFYHFQQSLDHLEAILFADTPEAKVAAERSAKAFLNRMRRMQEAAGTIRNEIQTVVSAVHAAEREAGEDQQ